MGEYKHTIACIRLDKNNSFKLNLFAKSCFYVYLCNTGNQKNHSLFAIKYFRLCQ